MLRQPCSPDIQRERGARCMCFVGVVGLSHRQLPASTCLASGGGPVRRSVQLRLYLLGLGQKALFYLGWAGLGCMCIVAACGGGHHRSSDIWGFHERTNQPEIFKAFHHIRFKFLFICLPRPNSSDEQEQNLPICSIRDLCNCFYPTNLTNRIKFIEV